MADEKASTLLINGIAENAATETKQSNALT